jgi:hypothetical protein
VMVAVGNHFFSLIFSSVYDYGGIDDCKGMGCLEITFLICAGANGMSVIVAIGVWLKKKRPSRSSLMLQ